MFSDFAYRGKNAALPDSPQGCGPGPIPLRSRSGRANGPPAEPASSRVEPQRSGSGASRAASLGSISSGGQRRSAAPRPAPHSKRSPRLRTKRDQLSLSIEALKKAQQSLAEVERDHLALAERVAGREEELLAQRERVVQLTAIARRLLEQLVDKEQGGELAALARSEMQDSIADPVTAFFDGQDRLSSFIEERIAGLDEFASSVAAGTGRGGLVDGQWGAGGESSGAHADSAALDWPGGREDEEEASRRQVAALVTGRLWAEIPTERDFDALFKVDDIDL